MSLIIPPRWSVLLLNGCCSCTLYHKNGIEIEKKCSPRLRWCLHSISKSPLLVLVMSFGASIKFHLCTSLAQLSNVMIHRHHDKVLDVRKSERGWTRGRTGEPLRLGCSYRRSPAGLIWFVKSVLLPFLEVITEATSWINIYVCEELVLFK